MSAMGGSLGILMGVSAISLLEVGVLAVEAAVFAFAPALRFLSVLQEDEEETSTKAKAAKTFSGIHTPHPHVRKGIQVSMNCDRFITIPNENKNGMMNSGLQGDGEWRPAIDLIGFQTGSSVPTPECDRPFQTMAEITQPTGVSGERKQCPVFVMHK